MKILSSLLFTFSFLVALQSRAVTEAECHSTYYTLPGCDAFSQAPAQAAPAITSAQRPPAAAAVSPHAYCTGLGLTTSQGIDSCIMQRANSPNDPTAGWADEDRAILDQLEDGSSSAGEEITEEDLKAPQRTYSSESTHTDHNECSEDLGKTFQLCDPKQSAPVMGVVSALKIGVSGFASMSQQGACGELGKLANNMNAATGAFSGFCSSQIMVCKGECSEAVKEGQNDMKAIEAAFNKARAQATSNPQAAKAALRLQELKNQTKRAFTIVKRQNAKCESYTQHLADAGQSLLMFAGVSMQMSQCQKLTGLDCKATPTNPICVAMNGVDCATAAGASSVVCICQKNPTAPQCNSGGDNGAFNSGMTAGTGTGADGGNLALSPFGGLGGGEGGGDGMFPAGGAPGEQAGGSLAKGGSGRGGAQESGGGNNGRGGGGAAGPGGSGLNTKIIGGYGQSGGGGGGGGSYGSSGSGSGSGSYGGKPGNPNLQQYLPGGKMDPSRAIAGDTGPDGITGPNTDIWKKVKTRYFAKKPSLLP